MNTMYQSDLYSATPGKLRDRAERLILKAEASAIEADDFPLAAFQLSMAAALFNLADHRERRLALNQTQPETEEANGD